MKSLNVRCETIKLLKGNIGGNLHSIGLDNDHFLKTPCIRENQGIPWNFLLIWVTQSLFFIDQKFFSTFLLMLSNIKNLPHKSSQPWYFLDFFFFKHYTNYCKSPLLSGSGMPCCHWAHCFNRWKIILINHSFECLCASL